EHRLHRAVDRHQCVEPFRELDVRLVRRHVEAAMRVQLELPLGRGDDLGRGVSDVQDRDARGEVDQTIAVDVLHARAVTIGWMLATPGGMAAARRSNKARLFGPGTSVTSLRSCGISMDTVCR